MTDAMNDTGNEAHEALALSALVWVLGEPQRADRLLALTGLDADMLRAGIGEPTTLAAVIDFLCGHEADLIACANDVGCKPEALVRARECLSGERIVR
jgi:Protein of unknown function (DUF3572)